MKTKFNHHSPLNYVHFTQLSRFFLVVACMFTIHYTNAQDTCKNSFTVGYGIATAEGLGATAASTIGVPVYLVTFGMVQEHTEVSGSGALFIEYRRNLGKHGVVAANMIYSRINIDHFSSYQQTEPYMKEKTDYVTFLAGMNWDWLHIPGCEIYSGLMLGPNSETVRQSHSYGAYDSHDQYGHLAYQFTAAGVRTGKKNLGCSMELGFGYKGFFNAGLTYRF